MYVVHIKICQSRQYCQSVLVQSSKLLKIEIRGNFGPKKEVDGGVGSCGEKDHHVDFDVSRCYPRAL